MNATLTSTSNLIGNSEQDVILSFMANSKITQNTRLLVYFEDFTDIK